VTVPSAIADTVDADGIIHVNLRVGNAGLYSVVFAVEVPTTGTDSWTILLLLPQSRIAITALLERRIFVTCLKCGYSCRYLDSIPLVVLHRRWQGYETCDVHLEHADLVDVPHAHAPVPHGPQREEKGESGPDISALT
jgi:hypothetical protein